MKNITHEDAALSLNLFRLFAKRSIRVSVLAAVLMLGTFAGCEMAIAGNQISDGASLADTFHDASPDAAEPYVQASLLADSSAVVPGKPFKLGVQLLMKPGWHTYYKESGEAGMPTRISWHLPPGFKVGELLWEKPHKFSDAGIVTYGYADQTLIAVVVTPPEKLTGTQPLTFSATVKWLSCKDSCVPGKAEVSAQLSVANTNQPANNEAFSKVGFDQPLSALTESGVTNASTTAKPVSTASLASLKVLDLDMKVAGAKDEHLNLPAYLILAFIGGFILNFMPCVLPVISIKVLGFMQQAGDHPKRIFQLGLTFTAGIVTAFMVLAGMVVAVQKAGQQVGWGFQFQYPVFLFGMSTLVLLFALSLFGLFYVQMAGGTEPIDKLAAQEGYVGTFFKGVLATALSTPCSAPFLGTALGFAFAQPAWVIVLIFLTISLGMAFPYILLTAHPAWMKYIPRPGVWMEKFKESMGFLLLSTVVWLLWVLAQQVGIDATMAAVGFLVAMSFAVWMVGRLTDLTSGSRRKAIVYTGAGLVLLAGYLTCLQPFPQLLSMGTAASLPVGTGLTQSAFITEPLPPSAAEQSIDWTPFSIDRLDSALQGGKTVFIDFTADWCLTCKVNENTVLNTPAVVAELKRLQVVTLRANWTRQDANISKLLAKFGRSGVPLYVIFPAGKPSEPIVLPEVINKKLVLENLQAAGASR